MDGSHHHHHQRASVGSASAGSSDVRPAHVFADYPQQYASGSAHGSAIPPLHDGLNGSHHNAIAANSQSVDNVEEEEEPNNPEGLFPEFPDVKKRKFILVDDHSRSNRLRVRVELEDVNTKEIPDSFRKRTAVYPRTFFPREMQSTPVSSTGIEFFEDDLTDDDVEVDGGRMGRSRGQARCPTVMVSVPMTSNTQGQGDTQGQVNTQGLVAVPRMRRGTRMNELKLNEIAHRLAWRHSRNFASRVIFLQRACKFSF